jgi:hypothetical protein
VLVAAWVAACVIIEPPSQLPGLPSFRPTILHASVVPKPQQVLLSLDEFVLTIETLKTNQSFEWNWFVDYPNGVSGNTVSVRPTDDQTTHIVQFNLRELTLDPNTCHLIEFIVGFRLDGHSASSENPEDNPRDAKNGDIVSWFYNPDGRLEGCPSYRGPDAAADDAEAGADAGPEAGPDAGLDALPEGGADGGGEGG